MAFSFHDRTLASAIHSGSRWRRRRVLLLNLYLLLPMLTACINGYDSTIVNGLQILPAWKHQFHDPRGNTLGIITSAQMIGSLAGLPFTPYCSDRFGRKATLVVGAILMLGGVALQAVASTVVQFVGSRVLVGAGLIFGINAAPLLIAELAYPTQRGKVTSLYNTMWYGGSIVAAWGCLLAYHAAPNSSWSWRAPVLVQALGPLLQLCLIWFIPESPRWLVSKGKNGKAARILARFHAVGYDERDPFVQYEMVKIIHALRMEEEINKIASFSSLFATPGNRKRMRIILGIAFFSQWSGNGLVSHYINLVLETIDITGTKQKATVNGCLQIWNLVAAATGALLIDKLGRRTLFVISNTGMLLAFSVWALTTSLAHTPGMEAASKTTVPLIFVFYLFYNLAYTPMLITYTLEILPYALRAKGFALMNLVVSLALAFNQSVDPWALNAIGWKYYLVYCAWLGFELIFVVLYIVETRGRTLEDTAALFDDGDKPDDPVQMDKDVVTDGSVIDLRRMSTLDGEDTDYIYSRKASAFNSTYDLQRPEVVLDKEQIGYVRGGGGLFSFGE